MDGWMDGWMDGLMDGCMDVWMYGCIGRSREREREIDR